VSGGLRSRVLARAATAADNGATRFDALLADCLSPLPDERRALVHLDRYLEASYSPQTVIDDFLKRPALAALFFRLVGVSAYAADLLVRDAQLFRWLTDGGGLETREASDMHAAARAAFDAFEREERRIASLKRWQRRKCSASSRAI
jgi:glutamine synthetase adenylyltransferase